MEAVDRRLRHITHVDAVLHDSSMALLALRAQWCSVRAATCLKWSSSAAFMTASSLRLWVLCSHCANVSLWALTARCNHR
jgi:hypothetical protein